MFNSLKSHKIKSSKSDICHLFHFERFSNCFYIAAVFQCLTTVLSPSIFDQDRYFIYIFLIVAAFISMLLFEGLETVPIQRVYRWQTLLVRRYINRRLLDKLSIMVLAVSKKEYQIPTAFMEVSQRLHFSTGWTGEESISGHKIDICDHRSTVAETDQLQIYG